MHPQAAEAHRTVFPGSQEAAIVLTAVYIDCTAVPADLHAQALVTTPVERMKHVLFRLDHRSQVFQLVGQIAINHTRCIVDRNIRART